MTVLFRRSALAVIGAALASVIQPPEQMAPSAWAAVNLTVPDGPRAGELWDPALTPYIVEPLDIVGPDGEANEIAVMKSAQTGFTTLMIAAVGHSIDRDPCRIMVVQPTDSALADFNREKLQVAIDGSESLKGKVADQASRSGRGSTTYTKRFPGGSVTLAIASSAADLRSKTIRKAYCDEIDQYPADLDGQGDPLAMVEARYLSFRATGDWRRIDVSTPTIKGESRIEKRYEAGDKRRWTVRCPDPDCGGSFVLSWGKDFRFERSFPHQAHYIAPCCGTVIEGRDKRALVMSGTWVATDPKPGAYPSYHLDTLSSPFVPWDDIAAAFVAAETAGDMKGFWNLWLGLPFDMAGDAPDHMRLMERREDGLLRGRIPSQGLLLTGFADVQHRGLWVEVVAWGPDRQSYTVEATYIEGETTDPEKGAFLRLREEILDKLWPDAFGGSRRLDALGVDAGDGTRSQVVYNFARGRSGVFATKGVRGWSAPAIGTASPVDITWRGKKIRKGVSLWPIGTWGLKALVYSDLRKDGMRAGAEVDPPGYCHFGSWVDEAYFKQLTAERLTEERVRGRIARIWKVLAKRDNHFLDCRVGNAALAEYLGMTRMTSDEWAVLAKNRGVLEELRNPDMFAPQPVKIAAPTAEQAADDIRITNTDTPAPDNRAKPAARKVGWLTAPRGGFLKR